MKIVGFTNKIKQLIDEVKPSGTPYSDMFYLYEYNSDTHWIKLGIPPEWFDSEGEEDEE